jgi:hypothetical protein
VEGLTGETVALFFRGGYPDSGGRQVTQLHGKVRAADADGVWVDPVTRVFVKKSEDYSGPVYVPWSAIGYVKVLPKK